MDELSPSRWESATCNLTDRPSERCSPISVSVIIPTFRRERGLGIAMASVAAQMGLAEDNLSLIVCDNSPEGSAQSQVKNFAKDAPFPVVFVHEPLTGVANARNSAVAACDAQFIAFLDDDEEATETWLAQILSVQLRYDADVVFGPVVARLENPQIAHRKYFEGFFSRLGAPVSQILNTYYGCGNSLIRRSKLDGDLPFEVSQNNMGGEDDRLFFEMRSKGAVMAWAAGARVFEDVPIDRARFSYTLRRAFAYGQGPSHLAAYAKKPLACASWMVQGCLQAILFSLLGTLLFLCGVSLGAKYLDRAARGLGKMLWFEPFKIGFYGTALLKPVRP